MSETMEIKTKLVPKEQWFCDFCGEAIESVKDGMLEWNSYLAEEKEITADKFRIVHHRAVKNCRPKSADDNLSDGHLSWYTGPDGLNELLSLSNRHNLDQQELNEIIKRIHVDYYEEGITYLPLARQDGNNEIDPYETGDLSQSDLKGLIRKYGK